MLQNLEILIKYSHPQGNIIIFMNAIRSVLVTKHNSKISYTLKAFSGMSYLRMLYKIKCEQSAWRSKNGLYGTNISYVF